MLGYTFKDPKKALECTFVRIFRWVLLVNSKFGLNSIEKQEICWSGAQVPSTGKILWVLCICNLRSALIAKRFWLFANIYRLVIIKIDSTSRTEGHHDFADLDPLTAHSVYKVITVTRHEVRGTKVFTHDIMMGLNGTSGCGSWIIVGGCLYWDLILSQTGLQVLCRNLSEKNLM